MKYLLKIKDESYLGYCEHYNGFVNTGKQNYNLLEFNSNYYANEFLAIRNNYIGVFKKYYFECEIESSECKID